MNQGGLIKLTGNINSEVRIRLKKLNCLIPKIVATINSSLKKSF